MSLLAEENDFRLEEFNIRFVKCTEPILIKDDSKTDEENKILRDSGYPTGYNHLFDCIIPPEEWEENGKTWRRVVSTNSINRKEMVLLEKKFWSQMEHWKINEKGLCQIRRELYLRYFDELIRQECILNQDLGELFIRIRDGFKFTMETYEHIYKDSLMISNSRVVINDQKTNELQNNAKKEEDKNDLMKKTVNDASQNLMYSKYNYSEELNALKASNNDELSFFNKNYESLKEQYNILLTNTGSEINILQ